MRLAGIAMWNFGANYVCADEVTKALTSSGGQDEFAHRNWKLLVSDVVGILRSSDLDSPVARWRPIQQETELAAAGATSGCGQPEH